MHGLPPSLPARTWPTLICWVAVRWAALVAGDSVEAGRTRKSIGELRMCTEEGGEWVLSGAGTWRPFLQESLTPPNPKPRRNHMLGSGSGKPPGN